MGILDGILGNVVGSLGAAQAQSGQNPLAGILGSLGGSNQSGGNNLLTAAMSIIQQNGGLGTVLDMFRQQGMSQQADSWVSTGPNQGISPDQVQQVFGQSTLNNVASQFGISHNQIGASLSQLLPELVNQFTPQGQLPNDSSDLVSQGLAMLKKQLG
jgi:uncharacterized protein YidB (DUF937 family)